MSLFRAWSKKVSNVGGEELTSDEVVSSSTGTADESEIVDFSRHLPSSSESGLGAIDHARVVESVSTTMKNNSSRASYNVYSPRMRHDIGKFASESGSAAAAVRKFKDRFPNINESTVRGFKKKYQEILKKQQRTETVSRLEITTMKRGRPLLLGAIDEKVQTFIRALRNRGGFVSRSIAVITAKVLLERCEDPSLNCLVPTNTWAKSLFVRMGYKSRAKTTDKVCIPEGAQKEAEFIYLNDIVRLKEAHNIPDSLVLNLDQTPSKLIQSSRYTMTDKGSKGVPLAGSSDKRTITATFVVTLSGVFLPIQLIYGGKTERSIPKVKFPESFSLSANPKHFSNTEESIKILNDVVVPYVVAERSRLLLSSSQKALIIMDVFRGQMTPPVISILKDNNILLVPVPANMTHLLQPLDLSVNSWAKNFMKRQFSEWYADKIRKELDEGKSLDEIVIKFQLSVLKPLHATWVIKMYNEITSKPDVVIAGWKSAGIYDAVRMGLQNLPSVDPFFEIDQLSTERVEIGVGFVNIDDELRVQSINSREDEEEDEEGDSEWEEDIM